MERLVFTICAFLGTSRSQNVYESRYLERNVVLASELEIYDLVRSDFRCTSRIYCATFCARYDGCASTMFENGECTLIGDPSLPGGDVIFEVTDGLRMLEDIGKPINTLSNQSS